MKYGSLIVALLLFVLVSWAGAFKAPVVVEPDGEIYTWAPDELRNRGVELPAFTAKDITEVPYTWLGRYRVSDGCYEVDDPNVWWCPPETRKAQGEALKAEIDYVLARTCAVYDGKYLLIKRVAFEGKAYKNVIIKLDLEAGTARLVHVEE